MRNMEEIQDKARELLALIEANCGPEDLFSNPDLGQYSETIPDLLENLQDFITLGR